MYNRLFFENLNHFFGWKPAKKASKNNSELWKDKYGLCKRGREIIWFLMFLDHSASSTHWSTVWSSPPVENSSSSLRLNSTVVTWLEWPLPFTLSLFFTRQGYSSTLISPLSFPVAMMFIPPAKVFLVRSMELISVPSVHGSKMPWTGQPKVTFQVAQS